MKAFRTLLFLGVIVQGALIFVRATWWPGRYVGVMVNRRLWTRWAWNIDVGRFRLAFGVE